ncbi:unnamed protein product, partial [Cuscuta epithymum]
MYDRRSIDEFRRVKVVLIDLLRQQNDFWKQRAKDFWLKEGGVNTKFFHNSVKQRRRINTMKRLKRSDGTWVSDRSQLKMMVEEYFRDLFRSEGVVARHEDLAGLVQVSSADNDWLLRLVTMGEVKKAVFAMHPDKAPGPDSLNPSFFQHYWDIVGCDVFHYCKNIFETGHLPNGVNVTNLVLIPKKENPENMGDWRP